MTSISGKTTIDWDAFADRLAPVEAINSRTLVRKRSRDYFWYSPILNEELKSCFGDLLALPKSREELAHCLSLAFEMEVPVTMRGGGTGNYGQAVPMEGGLIIETTALNRIVEIAADYVTAEAGALMSDINAALAPHGRELCMFPSTQAMATIGGFVAGGSSGIGSISNGMLRDPGNLISLRAFDVSSDPHERLFEGADVLQIHHAWGMNGVITEVTLRTVPAEDWVGCIATFDSYATCYTAGYALAQAREMGAKLISTVDARIGDYFPKLKGHVRAGKDLLVSMIPEAQQDDFRTLMEAQGGHVDLMITEEERTARKLPHVYDFSYNHTTLEVLKIDRSATYQQVGCPAPPDPEQIARLQKALGDEAWMHHEFALLGGEIVSFDLPIVWYKDRAQLARVNEIYEAHGFPVYDAHCWQVEGGGLKNADYRHLAWKKRMDPKGLLNSAKSAVWSSVKHLSAEEIEAKGATSDA